MPRVSSFLLPLVAILLLCNNALAEPVITPIPPGDDHITALAQGDKAPFTGQLFDTATSMRWANWLEQWRLRYRLDLEYQEKISKAQLELEGARLTLERESHRRVVLDYQEQVTKLQLQVQEPPWYKTVWFGYAVGVVGSVAFLVAANAATSAAK